MSRRKKRRIDPRRKRGVGTYIKEAFLNRWNLLGLAGGVGVALLSPIAPIALPLIGAAELLYLTGVISSDKFRSYADRKAYERERGDGDERREKGKSSPDQTLRSMVERLQKPDRSRFIALRDRCLSMRSIAHGVGGRTSHKDVMDDATNPGLDRLLWVFLRLLVSQDSLERFLHATDEDAIQRQLDEVKARVDHLEASSEPDERMLNSLRDSLATNVLRLENYQRANKNAEFVSIELERLESKIQTLSEMAVNRQDPDFISREVDSVTASITHTEETMNELNLVTGLIEDLDSPPVIMSGDFGRRYAHDD